MSLPFSPQSGIGQSFDLIPAGTLCWGIIEVRAIKLSQAGGQYIDLILHISKGPYENRKIFDRIMDPLFADNSDGAKAMGLMALTRICESGGLFRYDKPESYRCFDNVGIEDVALQIDGKEAAFKVKLERGKDGYQDKNCVAEWLSPNPESNGFKGYQQLIGAAPSADQARKSAFMQPAAGTNPAKPATTAAASSSFAQRKAAQTAGTTPAWLKNAQTPAPAAPPVVVPVAAPAGTTVETAAEATALPA